MAARPPLTIEHILGWADAYHTLHGTWPKVESGAITGSSGDTWSAVSQALTHGYRGLSGGSSLARLLAEHRGVRQLRAPPPLTISQILAWADAHHTRTQRWPSLGSGAVADAPGEAWRSIDGSLRRGERGLPQGQTLASVLAAHRGVPDRKAQPPLTIHKILAWADAHHARTGRWPALTSGPVREAPGETWRNLNYALQQGYRGLPGGETLAEVRARRRGVRHPRRLPPLRITQILQWADAHYRRYRVWPSISSGSVRNTLGEQWSRVDKALREGLRGLPGGSSVAHLLAEHRGVRVSQRPPHLTVDQILAWGDAHHRRTGRWPTPNSGVIPESPDENWRKVAAALGTGGRGLAVRMTLAAFWREHRGYRPHTVRPRLTERQILAWADEHHARTGRWPTYRSGPIPVEPGETWSSVHQALVNRRRGLRRRTTLPKLLADQRGYAHNANRARLTIPQILAWADAHHERTGQWPNRASGTVPGTVDTTWRQIEDALEHGLRGLEGGSSLARLLAARRGRRNRGALPTVTLGHILKWADAHHARTGGWPKRTSGPVFELPSEQWHNLDDALHRGLRGLPEGWTLARLLARYRNVRNVGALPPLTERKILGWARAHHRRTGQWPKRTSGEVVDASGERWSNLDQALVKGLRGLVGKSSLARLLAAES